MSRTIHGSALEGYRVPDTRRFGPLRDAWSRREVFWSLTLREIQVRYRQAWLGAGWALLQPVALMVVATLVFHRFLEVDAWAVSYPFFAFTGLFVWTYFHTAVSTAVPSLVANARLLKKIWFPREALVFGALAAAGLDLAVGALLWLGMVAVEGAHVGAALLALPPALAVLALATAGPALLGAAVNVRYRDVKHALPLLLQIVFFATPIVYPLRKVPQPWRTWITLNPLTGVVEGLRSAAFEGHAPAAGIWMPGTAIAILVFALAYAAFVRAGRRFADVV